MHVLANLCSSVNALHFPVTRQFRKIVKGGPHTKGHAEYEQRTWVYGNTISGRDPHQVWKNCLGLGHAYQTFENPGFCSHCTLFTAKSLRRQLECKASLSGSDTHLPTITPGVKEEREWTVGAGPIGSSLGLPPTPRMPAAMCLAPGRMNLSPRVIPNIQSA